MSGLNFLFAGALLFDLLLGDPRGGWHPVVLIGKLITFMEQRLLKKECGRLRKKAAGLLLLVSVAGLVYLTCYLLTKIIFLAGERAGAVGSALILSFAISPRALRQAAQEIYNLLLAGDIAKARQKTGLIVGRDTGKLDAAEITRATVETVAENITDGVISPLFFAAIGGAPLAFAYRAVNTLDSMVGYKNDRYLDFGWASARFDDICNYIPARISACLIVAAAAALPGCDPKGAFCVLCRDAGKHPSPNSGLAEAAVAGALGIRLGGCNYYAGRPSWRGHMGDARHGLMPAHIEKTVRIMYFAAVAFAVVLTAIGLW
ncbi:MAG: adenosylcobinamide-phosphate synthase CbiB [Acidaminococcales bacterium]|jgi:adenosylcobinamide-phosphate synthase|nr:adenosylcobinamide-phosphate synthase CbiB [Acidaminococcales bacterium]